MTTRKPTLDERKDRVRQRAGPDVDVQGLLLDLSRIDEEGVFVNVLAGGVSAMQTKLSYSALGVSGVPSNLAMKIGVPTISLLPETVRGSLMSPINRGYALLRRYGMSFMVAETFFGRGGHRYLPWRAFERFEEDFAREAAILEGARATAIEDWDSIAALMRADFLTLVTEARRKLIAQGAQLSSDFVDQTVNALCDKVPTPDLLATGVFLRRQIGILSWTSELLGERAAAAEAHARDLAARGDVIARERVIEEQVRAARLNEQLKTHHLDVAQREELEAKRRIQQLKLEEARARLEGVLSPLQEGAQQLALTLNSIVADMLESIRRNGYVHANTAKKAGELHEWFRLMNLNDDAQLEAMLERLKDVAQQPVDLRSAIDFDSTLSMIAEVTAKDARAAVASGRMSALEL